MNKIHILDQSTIDKIAAGEVVERPASIVKELVENAIDAGASRVTIEIRGGGISLIRVTDNGGGIAGADIPLAFLRHATSKIEKVQDLDSLTSLGFRGEALSSIAAVSRVELITKRPEDLTATRYVIEGGREKLTEEIGAPDGTTILVRDIFYNTPARAKFLKTALTEAAHVGDFVEQLILSNPGIAFSYLVNGQEKLSSSGSGKLMDAVYHIYGRDLAGQLVPIDADEDGIRIRGFIGKPSVSRGNRNFENYYVNGRYVKSRILQRGIEDGYGTKLMQHQYPFTAFTMDVEGDRVDVNVHPTKMDVRFSDEKLVYDAVRRAVKGTLDNLDMIVASSMNPPEKPAKVEKEEKRPRPAEAFEARAAAAASGGFGSSVSDGPVSSESSTPGSRVSDGPAGNESNAPGSREISSPEGRGGEVRPASAASLAARQQLRDSLLRESGCDSETAPRTGGLLREDRPGDGLIRDEESRSRRGGDGSFVQQTFTPKFLSAEAKPLRRIVGQVFSTYWIAEYEGKVYLFDQHAAHERVLFEQFMAAYENRTITSQQLSPPMIVTLDAREEGLLESYLEAFTSLGFEIESFGERDYAVRAVPYYLGTIDSAELFRHLLDQLEVTPSLTDIKAYIRRVATEACKAAVKGGETLSFEEAGRLLDDLMQCEDPYHCPHGRPTILSFTQADFEKRFKRIV